MANLEEDMRLGELNSDMPEHPGRLEGALPYTLVLFALAAFAALILWVVYGSMAGYNLENHQTALDKSLTANSKSDAQKIIDGLEEFTQPEKDWVANSYREQMGFEGAVLGFLVIISYSCVYAAMKIAHHRK